MYKVLHEYGGVHRFQGLGQGHLLGRGAWGDRHLAHNIRTIRYKSLCSYMLLFLLGKHLDMESLG